MAAVFNLLKLTRFPILDQLLLEEKLLRCTKNNYLIINQGTPSPAIVMGISGKPHSLLDVEKAKKDNITVIKRYSGGGTVVVDENTLFMTFIERYPREIMSWSETFYKRIFKDTDFKLRENDYVFGEQKFGGNAQCITRRRWVHHTSLLHDFRDDRMGYLLHPAKTPEYRNQRHHLDFICRLKENQNALVKAATEALYNTMKERQGYINEIDLEKAKTEGYIPECDHPIVTTVVDLHSIENPQTYLSFFLFLFLI